MCFNRGVYKVSLCQHHPFIHPPVHHPPIIPPDLSPTFSLSFPPSIIHPPTFPPPIHASIRSSVHTLINPSTHPSVQPFIAHPLTAVLKPRKSKRPEIKSSVLAHTVGAPELPSCSNGACPKLPESCPPLCHGNSKGACRTKGWENRQRPGALTVLINPDYLGSSGLHSSEEKAEETVRKEKGDDDWGLELEETEGPPNHEATASSST